MNFTASFREYYTEISDKLAIWCVTNVATMACAYLFAIIAFIALPQAIHDSFSTGFAPLPLVTWLSQSFLQLVLLAVLMKGQSIQGCVTERRDTEQYNAVMEMLSDMRSEHEERREILEDVRMIVQELAEAQVIK